MSIIEAKRLNEENEMLRKMLQSACIKFCHDCPSCEYADGQYKCEAKHGDCLVQGWRVAVGMDGGAK